MTDRNPIACWRSNPLIAKAITIRSRGGKPGRCVVKVAELTPGGLPVVLLCRSQQRALQGKPEAPDAGSQESKKTRQVPAPEPRQPDGFKLKTAPVRPVVAARPAEYVCSEE